MTKGKIIFASNLDEYFIIPLGLLFLSVITFGLAFPYWAYWSFNYFFSKLGIETIG